MKITTVKAKQKDDFIATKKQVLSNPELANSPTFRDGLQVILGFYTYCQASSADNVFADLRHYQKTLKDRNDRKRIWWATHYIMNEYVWCNRYHSFKCVLQYDFTYNPKSKIQKKV